MSPLLIARNFRKLKDEMKRRTVIHLIIILTLHLIATILISTCSAPTLSQFEVQRPSRITMPREVKKVFIREDLITANNDKLGIKSQVLQELAKLLNNMGRFKVSVVKSLDEKQIEAEKEKSNVLDEIHRKALSEAFSKIHGSNWKDAFTCEVPEKDFEKLSYDRIEKKELFEGAYGGNRG